MNCSDNVCFCWIMYFWTSQTCYQHKQCIRTWHSVKLSFFFLLLLSNPYKNSKYTDAKIITAVCQGKLHSQLYTRGESRFSWKHVMGKVLTHCRLNELSHMLYWKILISILGMSGYVILIFWEKNDWTICKQWRPWSEAAFCGIWSGSPLFANYPFRGLPTTKS